MCVLVFLRYYTKEEFLILCFYFQNSTDSPLFEQPFESSSNKVIVPKTKMHPGEVYIFTLTVYKAHRSPVSVNQTVNITFCGVTFAIPSSLASVLIQKLDVFTRNSFGQTVE